MEKYFEILRRCPLFHGIKGEELLPLMGCLQARRASFGKKQTVLAEGDAAAEVGLVLRGKVRMERTDYLGNRSILSSAGPGQLFAESFACAGGEMGVTVLAEEDTEILFLRCRRILQPCSNSCGFHRQLVQNLVQLVAGKNLLLNRKLEILSRRTTREKLMAYLLFAAKEAGSASFTIPFDRQGLADFLEVDRSGLSAELSRLRAEGVLTCRKNSFTLLV